MQKVESHVSFTAFCMFNNMQICFVHSEKKQDASTQNLYLYGSGVDIGTERLD